MANDNNNDRNKIRRKKVSSSSTTTSNTTNKSNARSNTTGNRSSKRSSNKKDKFKTFRAFGVLLLVLLVLSVAVSTAVVFVALKDVQPITKAALDKKVNTVTELLYSDGSSMGNPPSENQKKPIPISKMPVHLQHALVAIEDERFYEHGGVDIKGLARAAVLNIITSSSPGGSTIPMQVSKNLITSKEVSLIRKVKDIYYAIEMNKELPKEQILELYLNSAYFGRGAIGVEAAANAYFSKTASELSIAEAAMIVGITQNPSKYEAYKPFKLTGNETKEDLENKLKFFVNTTDDGFDDPTQVELNMVHKLYNWGLLPNDDYYEQLKKGTMVVRKAALNEAGKVRQETVLMKMLELGYLTQDEHDKAVNEKIEIKLPKPDDKKPATTVEDLIEKDILNALTAQGYTDSEANNLYFNGGLKIRTTIDKNIQKGLEVEFNNKDNFPGNKVGPDGIIQPQAAMVILDYRTGEIKALIGGRNIKARKVANRATTPKQPGSTIKTLSVFTPAIDNGKTQADVFSDVRGGYKFDHGKWNPKTTTAGRESMTLRKALAFSSNTIAIKLAETLGDTKDEAIDVMLDYLKNFGLSDLKDGPGGADRTFPALTLGGMTTGVSPLDMAAAYGSLANGGVHIQPITFTTVETSDGQILIQNIPEEQKVVSPEVAYVMTDMMTSVITEGTGRSASLGKMPVAGKTGTTNENKDAWFVGYTPYYVGATYIGDDYLKDPNTKQSIPRRGVIGGSKVPAQIWAKVMTNAHKNLNPIPFKKPSNIEFVNINLTDGGIVGKNSYNSASAAFIKGHLPSKYTAQPSIPVPEPPIVEEVPPELEVPENENENDIITPENPNEGENNNNEDNSVEPPTTNPPPVVSPPVTPEAPAPGL